MYKLCKFLRFYKLNFASYLSLEIFIDYLYHVITAIASSHRSTLKLMNTSWPMLRLIFIFNDKTFILYSASILTILWLGLCSSRA